MEMQAIKEITISLLLALCLSACGESDDERLSRAPKTMAEAASELETVFDDADASTKQNAKVAMEALKSKKYEKATVSLISIRNQDNLTFEQGMTVRNSLVTLQRDLIDAAEDGDPQAIKAIRLLQQK